MEKGKKKRLNNCEVIKYQNDYVSDQLQSPSMYKLMLKYKESSCDSFLGQIIITDADINNIEKETRDQHESRLWHELRCGSDSFTSI